MEIIVLGIIGIIIIFAVINSIKHFKGEGGCCGGGGELKPIKKKLDGRICARKIITIDGMHCEMCKSRVERGLNKLEGVSAEVKLKKNIAIVSMDREIAEEELKRVIEELDFRVVSIEDKEVK